MMKQYQVTLFATNGKYKPISTIVNYDTSVIPDRSNDEHIREIKNKGIKQICQKRYWTSKDLLKYGYTKCKIREYDKEKIEKENKIKYERIKQERGWIKKEEKS